MSKPLAIRPAPRTSSFWSGKLFRSSIVILTLALSAAIYVFRDRFAEWAAIGYPGIFLVSLLSNATIILPAPFLVLVFALGSALPPLLVGLVAGAGAALGELSGYAAGFGGAAVIEQQELYGRLQAWMRRYGGITLLVMSATPNPFFDLAGIAAGSLRYPLWRFLLLCWLGKTIKSTLVAWAGSQSLTIIQHIFR